MDWILAIVAFAYIMVLVAVLRSNGSDVEAREFE
jgi:hypothetical protein